MLVSCHRSAVNVDIWTQGRGWRVPTHAGDFPHMSMVQVVCDHRVCVAGALRGIPGNREVTLLTEREE